MADYRRINLRLNLDRKLQREAWEILECIPYGQRSETICRALTGRLQEEDFTDVIRKVLREELSKYSIGQNTQEIPQEREDDAVLSFLQFLEEGDGI